MLDNAPDCYVKSSKIHGSGLFAYRSFQKGEVVLDFSLFPEIWKTCKYSELSEEKKKRSGHIMLNNETCLTSDKVTKFRYVNHSRKPSCDFNIANRKLVALHFIEQDAEITIDYRQEPLPENTEYPVWV